MRTFAISDIHGNNDTFRKALKFIKLKKTDKLILLGDCIDRGYDSKGVLDTIILLKEHGFNIVCLKGNHEQMFLDSFEENTKLNNWMLNGGKETLLSFLTASIEKIPSQYVNLIKSFKYYYEFKNFIFVHAAINMLIEKPFDDTRSMLWSREQDNLINLNWLKGRVVVHGHNPTPRKDIIKSLLGQIICIDNGSFIKKRNYGSICVLELENLNINFID
ncbi:metallophosphoesterase [Flavobacterium sp. CSZ]|uniref:metallophosphoesterase n=1 Tax=Flavobacterium sp. CSZ TaxID=2783791 RepID=UPI00188AAEEB|nr:metallophosphoesterase [Flavobacterium sp. CSZ]MBF4487743.1 serine/threonine protein phosphatase [Flavobacterium sp. CSZ]